MPTSLRRGIRRKCMCHCNVDHTNMKIMVGSPMLHFLDSVIVLSIAIRNGFRDFLVQNGEYPSINNIKWPKRNF